jgi:hypothetical protein
LFAEVSYGIFKRQISFDLKHIIQPIFDAISYAVKESASGERDDTINTDAGNKKLSTKNN